MSNPFEPAVEHIGSFQAPQVGELLLGGLSTRWPSANVTLTDAQHNGHSMKDILARTDPLTASEMRAFVQGFFTAYNRRNNLT